MLLLQSLRIFSRRAGSRSDRCTRPRFPETKPSHRYQQCCGSGTDPQDPYVFGSPGSRSISQEIPYGSGSGSFYYEAKIVRKTLISTVLWLLYYFLSLKNDVKSKKKLFVDVLKVTDENSRIRIHQSEVWSCGSGSIPKFHGSATLDTSVVNPDPVNPLLIGIPDPQFRIMDRGSRYETDPQH